MDFEKQLKDDQAVVEVALEAFVRQFPGPEALGEAMGYSLLSGGKRIRPILVLEVIHSKKHSKCVSVVTE